MKKPFLLLVGIAALLLGHHPAAHANKALFDFNGSERSPTPEAPPELTGPRQTIRHQVADSIPEPPPDLSAQVEPPLSPPRIQASDYTSPASDTAWAPPGLSSEAISPVELDQPPGYRDDRPSTSVPERSFPERPFPERSFPERSFAPAESLVPETSVAIAPEGTSTRTSASAPSGITPAETEPVDSKQAAPQKVELTFDLDNPNVSLQAASTPAPPVSAAPASKSIAPSPHAKDYTLTELFKGEANSLVAIAVGSAEGTRTPDGAHNPGYFGHTDPGNGVWNLGSFSYQHGASSPEEADSKQLKRLWDQAQAMQQKAANKGIDLTLEEILNGIDLANQAPKAALEVWGYVDWLAEAHRQGMRGSDAVLWARVHSFIDPDTQQWNAPGLGNDADSITYDQERRMLAIADALSTYPQIARGERRGGSPIGWFGGVEQGVARLFAQNAERVFESTKFHLSETATAIGESAIVQQILDLDLSDLSFI